jgi:hypothetical protein
MTKILAEAIARDMLSGRRTVAIAPACFACGRTYSKDAPKADNSGPSRFCSAGCRDAFDAGLPPYEPERARDVLNVPLRDWVVAAGPPGTVGTVGTRPYARDAQPMTVSSDGFLIACKGCRKPFVSRGLRCCSTECERKHRERDEIAATMAEVGAEPIRESRKCEQCDANIPRWLPGGRGAVPKTRRFCSESCQKKARRLSAATKAVLSASDDKKPPPNGGSQPPPADPSPSSEAAQNMSRYLPVVEINEEFIPLATLCEPRDFHLRSNVRTGTLPGHNAAPCYLMG